MTVIAAALTKAGVIMAADSQISAGWQKKNHASPKIWVAGNQYAMGSSGTLRMAQILRHHTKWPRYRDTEDGDDLERFAVTQLVPAIKSAAREQGALITNNGLETFDAQLLFTVDDRILTIGDDGAVVSDPCDRMAIGSGYAEALGSLGDRGPWTEADVTRAVYWATLTAQGCTPPITVINCRKLTRKTVVPKGE